MREDNASLQPAPRIPDTLGWHSAPPLRAAGDLTEDALAAWLRQHAQPRA